MTDNNARRSFKTRKSVSGRKDKVEKEMKEYAETAMNELLGWYGYDKMNTKDTQALNLSLFSAAKSSASTSTRSGRRIPNRKRATRRNLSDGGDEASGDSISSDISSEDSNETRFRGPTKRETSSSPSNSNVTVPDGFECCGWCQTVANYNHFTFKMANCDKVFCSEVCFTHYRRANFKRSKTCDWCRHVRHTVNYVDLQDGDTQYQFCSDKCLNQFKLDIFCQETKEHMELHPHHNDPADGENTAAPLITPDLWLKNCNSDSEKSVSSSPSPLTTPISTVSIPDKLVQVKIEPTTLSTTATVQTGLYAIDNNDLRQSDDTKVKKQKRNFPSRKSKIKVRKSLQTLSSSCSPPLPIVDINANHRNNIPPQQQHHRSSPSLIELPFWPPKSKFSKNDSISPPSPFYRNFSSTSAPRQSDLIRPPPPLLYNPVMSSTRYLAPPVIRSSLQQQSPTIPTKNPFPPHNHSNNNNNNNNNMINLPVPPLLPITTHPMLQHLQQSHLQAPTPQQPIPPPRQPITSTDDVSATLGYDNHNNNKSLLPPPILLVPHPIAIPIPIPIPFPIPIPIFLNKTDDSDKSTPNDGSTSEKTMGDTFICDCENRDLVEQANDNDHSTRIINSETCSSACYSTANNNNNNNSNNNNNNNNDNNTGIIDVTAENSATATTTGRSRKKRRIYVDNNEMTGNKQDTIKC